MSVKTGDMQTCPPTMEAVIAMYKHGGLPPRARVTSINGDPFMTQLAKRPELLASYDTEISDLQKVIRLNQEAVDTGALKDQSAIVQRQKQIDQASQEIAKAQNDRKLQTDAGQFQGEMVRFSDSLGSAGKDAADVLTGTLNTAIDSISQNIVRVTQGTETWGQAFQDITTKILSDLEELVIKMTLQLALQETMSSLSGQSPMSGTSGLNGLSGLTSLIPETVAGH